MEGLSEDIEGWNIKDIINVSYMVMRDYVRVCELYSLAEIRYIYTCMFK